MSWTWVESKLSLPPSASNSAFLRDLGFAFDVEAGDEQGHRVAVATEVVDADLRRWRGRCAFDALDPYAVWSLLAEPDAVEVGDDVRCEIPGTTHLVEQLSSNGADGHQTSGARVLGYHGRSVGPDLSDRESAMPQPWHIFEERVVTSGALRPAFDDVAGHDRPGQGIPIVGSPAESPRRRATDECCIRDAPGDDDVRATVESCRDSPAAEVGVGGDGLHSGRGETGTRVHVVETDTAFG